MSEMFPFPNNDILTGDIGKYTNLHCHSVFSNLDGFAKLDDLASRAKLLGFKGLSVSDHGNVFSHYHQNVACKKAGIKPIFANETYIAPGSRLVKEKIEGEKAAMHVLLIAQNDIGYKNLLKITSDSWTKGKYFKPRTDLSVLAAHSEGVVCLSACIGGIVCQYFLQGRLELAEDTAKKFKAIFGDNYYLECTYTGMEEQDRCNKFLLYLSKKLDIKLVITADSHYTYRHESSLHRSLVTINTAGVIKESISEMNAPTPEKKDSSSSDTDDSALFYNKEQYFLKTYSQLKEYFDSPEYEEAFQNTNDIAESCNVSYKTGMVIIPDQSSSDESADQILRRKVYLAYDRYQSQNLFSDEKKLTYIKRIEEELGVIRRMGFSDYFLVVHDYVSFAKNSGILVGPGRGSGAGSLVAFFLSITTVDPIEYNLLFSRMLSYGRSKRPVVGFAEYSYQDYLEQRSN